jgi:hypothetical protein
VERERNYGSEVCRLLREWLIDERKRPIALDPAYDFQTKDVRLEPGRDGNDAVILFRICGKDRLLGYRTPIDDRPEMVLPGNPDHESPRSCLDTILVNLTENLDTGTISEPDMQGISWVQPRSRRGHVARPDRT